MAADLEMTQVSQLLNWLEAERKKDKALLATLEERLQSLSAESQQQARRIQELDSALAGARATLSKMAQIDRFLDEYKAETKALLDRRDDDRKKAEREASRLRAVEIEELNRTLAEIKKDLLRLGKLDEEMGARRAEEKRLGDQMKQLSLQMETATKQVEERTRGIPYLEEGRRQDNKRIVQLEAGQVDHGQRIESVIGKQHLLEDALGKTATRIETQNERLSAQDKTIEETRIMEFRRQQQMKTWEEELVKFRAQMADYGDAMARLREQGQINQKAASDLAAFQESLRQRAAEIAEVERLFEDRTKRALEQDRAEDEKRWQKHLAHIDARWHEHDRRNADQLNRIDKLETARDSLMDAIDDSRRKFDDLVHRLIDFGTGLAETRRSTLPAVSVPPATSPEDGRGIPDPRPRKRN